MSTRDPADRPPFALVDMWTDTPEAQELVLLDRLLALKLAGYFYEHRSEARPSVNTLARRMGMSKRSVEKALSRITSERASDGIPFVRKRGGSPKGGSRFGSSYNLNLPYLYSVATQSGLAKPATPVETGLAKSPASTSEIPDTDWRNPVRGLAKPRSQEDLTERSNGKSDQKDSAPLGALFLTGPTSTTYVGPIQRAELREQEERRNGASTATAWVERGWTARATDLRHKRDDLRAAYITQARRAGEEPSNEGWEAYLLIDKGIRRDLLVEAELIEATA